MKINKIILILAVLAIGCKDEFLLDSKMNQNLLVVDGTITNESGPYTIKLSLTSNVDAPQNIPYTGCSVILFDNLGNSEVLTESFPGTYVTAIDGMQGVVGNEYRISIITSDGKEYETDFQRMMEPVEIDSVFTELYYQPHIDYPFGIPGLKFLINTKMATTDENYFLWKMNETYEYDIDYTLLYLQTRFGDYLTYNPRYDTIETCWKTQNVNYIITGKTTNLTIPQIVGQELYFVSTETKRLAKRYSVEVSQYTIDEQTYYFWKELEKQISNQNFLVTTQPYNIRGNIKNSENIDELVLGYFNVASVSKKRIFVDRPAIMFYYPKVVVITDQKAINEFKRTHEAPYFYVEISDGLVGILTHGACLDCRTEGGVLQKPDFWVDNKK
jgi:hypothetical protein